MHSVNVSFSFSNPGKVLVKFFIIPGAEHNIVFTNIAADEHLRLCRLIEILEKRPWNSSNDLPHLSTRKCGHRTLIKASNIRLFWVSGPRSTLTPSPSVVPASEPVRSRILRGNHFAAEAAGQSALCLTGCLISYFSAEKVRHFVLDCVRFWAWCGYILSFFIFILI